MDLSFRFYLPPDLFPIVPHFSPVDNTSLSLCTLFFPGAPTRRTSPLIYTSLHIPGGPKELLAQAVPAFPLTVSPPCRPQPVTRSLSAARFSRTGVPSYLYLPPSTSRPPPPVGLDRLPSPLLFPGGGVVFFSPLSPVILPLPFRFTRRLLVSS